MTDFDESRWADPEFGRRYLDNADIYIVERRRMFEILKSFYRHFLSFGQNQILDLGCGDGILTHELLKIDPSLSATLTDGSEDMLKKARKRLEGFKKATFIKASFQDLLARGALDSRFDLVFSSQAIHHLTMDEKYALFRWIHAHLNRDGHFVNIDVVLPPAESLEEWYMTLWKEWMDERKAVSATAGDQYDDIIQRYKDNKDNKPDTLDDQMNALKKAGFCEVDCYYKYGIFSIYGGKKA